MFKMFFLFRLNIYITITIKKNPHLSIVYSRYEYALSKAPYTDNIFTHMDINR